MLQVKTIKADTLDKIISSKKIDLRRSFAQMDLTKEFLEDYFQGIIVNINSDREFRNKILDSCDMHIIKENDVLFTLNGVDIEDIPELQNKIIINSNTVDAVAEAHNVMPSEIEEAVDRVVSVSSFGCVYEINDIDTNSDKKKVLSLKTLILDYQQIQKVLAGDLTAEEVDEMKAKTIEMCQLTIYKTNFSNAVSLRDEYLNRLCSGVLFDKDFIDKIGKIVKIKEKEQDEKEMDLEQFIRICDKSLILAYDLINLALSYNYNTNQKKTQFSIKIV